VFQIDEKGEFTVQFYDYGNVETCKHEDLRSTLYMTEVPQLCHKGFFSVILPVQGRFADAGLCAQNNNYTNYYSIYLDYEKWEMADTLARHDT